MNTLGMHRLGGFSLLETLVSLAVGLIVVSSATVFYFSSSRTYQSNQAVTQMTEDASVALAILRTQIALAGYSNPTGIDEEGALQRTPLPSPLFGCTGGMSSTSLGSTEPSDIECLNATNTPDALVVRYEADRRNTMPTSSGNPTDCLGNSTPKPDGVTHLADNRYFIQRDTLSCRGNGHTVSQPLLDNVVDMHLRYGITDDGHQHITRYLSAEELSAGVLPAANAPLWKQVKAVRMCLVMRSEFNVLDTPSQYRDCQGNARIATDRKLYRAFSTTVYLPNALSETR